MFSAETVIGFMAAATLLAWIPGPDNLFVLTQSAICGARVGFLVTLGLCTGLILQSVAVALGVAAIFQSSAFAFVTLKIVGAGYLTYLAYKALTAAPQNLDSMNGSSRSRLQMYLRGILMNVTNPKVTIFFLAFLPQFTSPASGNIALQMLMLGGLFIVCAFCSFSVISALAGLLSRWLRRSERNQTILNRGAAIVFFGLAAKLAAAQR